jgi:hypothetical protein
MAKYASPEFLDGGFTAFKANVNKVILLKAYSAGDSYATVNVTNNICEAPVDTSDFALSGADAAPRVMTFQTGTSGTASDDSTQGVDDLHIAFVDTVNSKVYLVTDETTNQSVTSGNTVNFPSLTYTSGQPT